MIDGETTTKQSLDASHFYSDHFQLVGILQCNLVDIEYGGSPTNYLNDQGVALNVTKEVSKSS